MYRKYINQYGMEVWLPQEIYDELLIKAAQHYPKECGGIFVGKVKDNIAVIEMSKMPIRFFNTNVLFRRIAGWLNVWLTEIFKKEKGEVIYIGEWHTHPDCEPNPSGKDISALLRIAQSEDVRTENPVMLIIGFNRHKNKEKFYTYYNHQIITYGNSKS